MQTQTLRVNNAYIFYEYTIAWNMLNVPVAKLIWNINLESKQSSH